MSASLIDRKLRDAEIPIAGVYQIGPPDQPQYAVDYLPEATASQRNDGNAIVTAFDRTLETARQAKRESLVNWWSLKEREGITPTGRTTRLGMSASDVALLTGQFVLAKTAVELGAKTPQDKFVIVGKKGDVTQLTLAELTAALLDYGEQRTALSTQFLTYQAAIEQAASIAELDAVSLPNESAAGRTSENDRRRLG
jgi:hypothetical protein